MPKSRRLTKQAVLDTAARLANQAGGVDAVSLTALAAELDIRVPSLYNHVAGLEGLRRDLQLYAGRDLLHRVKQAAQGQVGLQALKSMAHAYRAFAHEQPGLYPLTVIAPEPDETKLIALSDEWIQLLLLVTASCGLYGEDALHAIRGYRAVVHGFVSLEAAGGYKMALALDESFSRLLNTYVEGLPTAPDRSASNALR